MRTSLASQLPTWAVGEVRFGYVELTCPRTRCRSSFTVSVRAFWRKTNHRAAPCPYCFGTAWRGKRPTKETS